MKKIKIVCIGNYPPRECGIATFTKDLVDSLTKKRNRNGNDVDLYVIAISNQDQFYNYPDDVQFVIKQDHQRDYLKAAKFINHSDADACIIQHEFGIFGGDDGIYILPLIRRLKIPLIVTLHTLLKKPNYNEEAIIKEIGKRAEKIVVMSRKAIDFLVDIYNIPEENIELIYHGTPDYDFSSGKKLIEKLNFKEKKILFTFGLINRNKGIETVIEALPKVIERYPNVVYIILGKTHPNVLRVSGEEYRNELIRLVERNNLKDYVCFYNHFVSNNDLYRYLTAIDIFISPYFNKAQITSGTLAYALGAGRAIISTPYWYAEEVLVDGRGRLFNFGDSDELASIIIELLDNSSELIELRKKAYDFGCKTTWPLVGNQYLNLIYDSIKLYNRIEIKEESIVNLSVLPKFSLKHIERLTDSTGIVKHAKYNVPNFKDGYCLDDNARALLMAVMSYRQKKDKLALKLMQVYLGYIYYMQNENGTFRNFLSFNRNFLDKVGSEDSFGRAIWALGYLVRFSPSEIYFQFAKEMLAKAYPNYPGLKSIRGISNTVIGISHYLHRFPEDERIISNLRNLTNKLIQEYEKEKSSDWHWFEPILTYDNGIIPLSLFHAYEILGDESVLRVAKESMEFLESISFTDEYLSLIGNEGWYKKGGKRSQYAQQPIDAMAMIMMYYQAFIVIGDRDYIKKMYASFKWFLGDNDLCIHIYDFETHGCNDGLESYGVNRNQGAESTLAYLISHLTFLMAHEKGV